MKTVDVVLPLCNEGAGIGATLVRLADYFSIYSPAYKFDFVVVDDGSTDETNGLALTFARYRPNVTVLTHDRRYGIGRALRTAFNKATADYTLVVDARIRHAPYVAMQLLEALDTAGSDIALVSPYNRPKRWLSQAKAQYAKFTGMVRAYRTAFLKHLAFSDDGCEANAEILEDAIRKYGAILEVPEPLQSLPMTRSAPPLERVRTFVRRVAAIGRMDTA